MKKKNQKLDENMVNQMGENNKQVNGKQANENAEEITIQHNVELEELKKQSKEYFELAQRTLADFDNYKKRTIKEKEMIYAEAVNNLVSKLLPILDGLESALKFEKNDNSKSITDGVQMIVRQFKDTLQSIGVEEIKAKGEKFDPKYHYAVAHIDDSSFGENEIIEELQRGYIINEKVIRHSMVKVAN